jgi:hypothetical protein
MDTLATKNNPRAVRDALDVLPTEVEATYSDAMCRITAQSKDDKDLAENILVWVIYARQPLSLRELQHAVAILPRMTDIDPGLNGLGSAGSGLEAQPSTSLTIN